MSVSPGSPNSAAEVAAGWSLGPLLGDAGSATSVVGKAISATESSAGASAVDDSAVVFGVDAACVDGLPADDDTVDDDTVGGDTVDDDTAGGDTADDDTAGDDTADDSTPDDEPAEESAEGAVFAGSKRISCQHPKHPQLSTATLASCQATRHRAKE